MGLRIPPRVVDERSALHNRWNLRNHNFPRWEDRVFYRRGTVHNDVCDVNEKLKGRRFFLFLT